MVEGDLEDDLAAFGVSGLTADAIREDASDDESEQDLMVVPPDNQTPVEVFLAVATQWNYTMAGVTGLRYEALVPVVQLYARKPAKQRALFEDVRLIERGALKVILSKSRP